MRHFLKYSFPLLILLILSNSCKKEDVNVQDELPPITQEGLNTFGCKINGEVLVPKDGISTSLFVGGTKLGLKAGNPHAGEDPVKSYVFIEAENFSDQGGDYIYLHLQDINDTGEYLLGNSTGSTLYENSTPYHSIALLFDNEDNGVRYYSFEDGGKINVTRYDTVNAIVSGTFAFDLVLASDPLSDTISVTEGSFDINWRTLNAE